MVASKTAESLKMDWSVKVTSIIRQDLDQHFDFYEDDLERYSASRMSRFFRTINLIMSYQLRSLTEKSLNSYTQVIYFLKASSSPRKPPPT